MQRVSLHPWIHVAVPLFSLGAWVGVSLATEVVSPGGGASFRLAADALELATVLVSVTSLVLLAFDIAYAAWSLPS